MSAFTPLSPSKVSSAPVPAGSRKPTGTPDRGAPGPSRLRESITHAEHSEPPSQQASEDEEMDEALDGSASEDEEEETSQAPQRPGKLTRGVPEPEDEVGSDDESELTGPSGSEGELDVTGRGGAQGRGAESEEDGLGSEEEDEEDEEDADDGELEGGSEEEFADELEDEEEEEEEEGGGGGPGTELGGAASRAGSSMSGNNSRAHIKVTLKRPGEDASASTSGSPVAGAKKRRKAKAKQGGAKKGTKRRAEGSPSESDEDFENEDLSSKPKTARQLAREDKSLAADLQELPLADDSKKRKLTETEIALRRSETARRRRNQSEKKLEDDKIETINRLLKKQVARSRTKEKAGADESEGEGGGGGGGAGGEDTPGRAVTSGGVPIPPTAAELKAVPRPFFRYIDRREGATLSVPLGPGGEEEGAYARRLREAFGQGQPQAQAQQVLPSTTA